MRIIAGKFKSRKLNFPRTHAVRPAMDRVRESIFNILGETIYNARVLDLYAGSGSIGFEALSRGAQYVCFVDNNGAAVKSLKENRELLQVASITRIMPLSVLRAIPLLHKDEEVFDFIFIDPPYRKELTKKTLMKLNQFDILAPNGKLIIEHTADETETMSELLEIKRVKKYGQTYVTFAARRAT